MTFRQTKTSQKLALSLSMSVAWLTIGPSVGAVYAQATQPQKQGVKRKLTPFEKRHIKGSQGEEEGTPLPGGVAPSNPTGEPDSGSTFPWEGSVGDLNTLNGNKLTKIPLVSWSGRGLGVSLTLYHNSEAVSNTEVGQHWTHTYDIYGSVTPYVGDFKVQWGDNLEYKFTKNVDGSFTAPAGIFETLTYNATTQKYTLTKKDQVKYTFSQPNGTRWNCTSISDRNNNTVTITHNANDYVTGVTDPTGRTLTFAYNGSSQLTSVTDPMGRVFTLTRNGSGDLTQVTFPTAGSQTPTTQFGYNAQHSITSLTDARGKVWTYSYTANGLGLAWEKDPLNNQTTYTYTAGYTEIKNALNNTSKQYYTSGKLTSVEGPTGDSVSYSYTGNLRTGVTVPGGFTTSYTYDAKGNILTKTNALGNVTTATYNANNDPLTVSSPSGKVTSYTYNATGNLTSVTNPLSQTSTFAVNSYGQVTSASNPLGFGTSFVYDTNGNRTSIVDPLGNTTTSSYNVLGWKTAGTDATGKTATIVYNNLGKVTSITSPGSRTITSTYDLGGNKLTQTNPLGQVDTFTYDDRGLVLTHTDGLNRTVTLGYDVLGQKTSLTDARGKVTTYVYNSRGLRTSIGYPDATSQSYSYNNRGLIATSTDGRNVAATNTYDALGRVTNVSYSASSNTPSVTTAFNSDGWKTSMTDGSGTTSYVYDNAGRLTTRTAPQGAVTYAYDNAGRLTTRAGAGSTVTYGYDSANRMTSTVVGGTQTTTNTYDGAGRLLTATKPDGSVETNTYSATTADLTSIVSAKAGITIASSTYAYDNLGRKTNDTGIGYAVSYGYDNAGQLTSEVRTSGNAYNITYAYDLAGNRSSKTLNGTVENYTYDNANKLLTAGSKSYTYDLAGNVTGVTGGGVNSTLAWDAESRLKSATVGTQTTTYSYNGLGQRVAKNGAVSNAYLLADDTIDTQVLSEGNATYAYGASGIISENRGGTSKFYHEDALGSVRALTNTSGTITDSKSTDAFGMSISSTGTTPTPFGFAGAWSYQQDSETGLMRLGHRMYDATTGRFISRDPIRDRYNWYTYCNNDPINAIDPEGLNDNRGNWKGSVVVNESDKTLIIAGDYNDGSGHEVVVIIYLPPGASTIARGFDPDWILGEDGKWHKISGTFGGERLVIGEDGNIPNHGQRETTPNGPDKDHPWVPPGFPVGSGANTGDVGRKGRQDGNGNAFMPGVIITDPNKAKRKGMIELPKK
jgi:RHS repeat-associated protein